MSIAVRAIARQSRRGNTTMNIISFQSLRYSVSLVPSLLVIAGNVSGGYWTLLNTLFTLFFLVITDWFFADETLQPEPHSAFVADAITILHVLTHLLSIASLIYGIQRGTLTGGFIGWAALSTGLNSGVSGIITAHELIHRDKLFWRAMGIWNLLTVNYTHFFIEHIRGHHKFVATPADPATARFGETSYGFVARTIPEQFISALKIEAARLKRQRKSEYGLSNFVVAGVVAQAALMAAIYLSFSATALLVYVMQSAVAIFLLELTNYAEHYGLERAAGQKVDSNHAWQSDNLSTRLMLLELSRHSDHHAVASRPYHELKSHSESPVLPSGYLGILPLVLVPPVWFKVMHPRVAKANAASRAARETIDMVKHI